MTRIAVLDASALLAVALHEPGSDIVLRRLAKSGNDVCIHAVNAFEVVTKLRQRGLPKHKAWSVVNNHIARVDDIGDAMLEIAVRIKHSAPSLSLGDCFCLALTEYIGGVCLTSDKAFLNAETTATVELFRA